VADDTRKPADIKSTSRARSATAAGSDKSATTKAAGLTRAAKVAAPADAKPARKRTPSAAKTATTAAKKAVTRSVAGTSSPTKKIAQETKPIANTTKADKPAKVKKAKLVRDSFTMLEEEYALIAALKKRCLNAGRPAKKSEILRAAVANLAKLGDASVTAAVRRLEEIKTGQPSKHFKKNRVKSG
jgi:hypothetical protein